MIFNGIKISIYFTEDLQNIEIISVESNGNKKYYQICYKGEVIELNRGYENLDEIVVRR